MTSDNVLSKYSIEMAATPEVLVAATEQYEALVAQVKEETESASEKESEIRKSLSEEARDSAREVSEAILSEVRKLVFSPEFSDHNIEETGEPDREFAAEVFALLYDGLKDVKTDARTFRDSYVSELARKSDNDSAPSEDAEELKEDAEALKAFVENLFGMLHPMGAVPEDYEVKDLQAGTKPKLSRLPIVRRSSGDSGVTVSHIVYNVDGEEVPERNLSVIARDYLSSPENVVTRKDITAALKGANVKGVTDTPWSVEINGHTLSRDENDEE